LYAVCTAPAAAALSLRLQTNGGRRPVSNEEQLEPTWLQGGQDFRCSYSCSSCRQTAAICCSYCWWFRPELRKHCQTADGWIRLWTVIRGLTNDHGR